MAKVKYLVGDGLGNIVHALPAIEAIRTLDHDLTVCVVSSWREAVDLIDHEHVVYGMGPPDAEFDVVWGGPTLAWIIHKGDRPFVNVPAPPHSLYEVSEVEANFWIAQQLGYTGPVPAGKPRVDAAPKADPPYIVIAPGFQRATASWKHKAYPHWADVASFLDQNTVVAIGGKADVEPWMDDLPHVVNLCEQTSVKELVATLAAADAVVGVDNGPTAIAAALGVPTTVLWGPTNMVKNHKHGPKVTNLCVRIECRPCQNATRFLYCPTNQCMTRIDPEKVAEAAQQSVDGTKSTVHFERPKMTVDCAVAVIGPGRSGTNMVCEMLALADGLRPALTLETQNLLGHRTVEHGAVTKTDTAYISHYVALKDFLNANEDVRVVWTVRDPRDMALSKMRRGVPVSEGGDRHIDGDPTEVADDATPEGCVRDIRHATDLHRRVTEEFPGRVLTVEMEDVLQDPEGTARAMCRHVGAGYRPRMLEFWKHIRLPEKRKRYTGIDLTQLGLWKRWRSVYDGFFGQRDDVPDIFRQLDGVVHYWNYEPCENYESLKTTGFDPLFSPMWQGFYDQLRAVDPATFADNLLMQDIITSGSGPFLREAALLPTWNAVRETFTEHPTLAKYAEHIGDMELSLLSARNLYEACLVCQHVGPLDGKHIIEFGCGVGNLARILLDACPRIAAYHLFDHEVMLRFARQILGDRDNVVYHAIDEERFQCLPSKADLFIANQCLTEATDALRSGVRDKVYPRVAQAFVLDGDGVCPELVEGIKTDMEQAFGGATVHPVPAMRWIHQHLYVSAVRGGVPCESHS